VDRRIIGDGETGPISAQLQRIYFDVVKGRNPKYLDWLTPINAPTAIERPKVSAS
jgi:branched-chain amino acid aminotransferase